MNRFFMEEQVDLELDRVFTDQGGYTLGHGGVVRIAILTDGNGLTGKYDRVHVHLQDGRHLIHPAHACFEMSVKNDLPEKE